MSKNVPSYHKQLILVITLCVLGTAAYWLEYGKKPKDEAAQADGKKVFVLKNAPVAKIEIQGETEKATLSVTLECESLKEGLCGTEQSSQWEMTAPLKTKADDAAVNGLLKNFGNLTSSDLIDLKSETPEKRAALLKDYGLSPEARSGAATRKLRFTLADGRVMTGYFGVKSPTSDGVFSVLETNGKIEDTVVYLVPNWQISIFDQKTSFLRDKRLTGLNEKDVTSFTLSSPKLFPGKGSAKKTADGTWQLKLGHTEAAGDTDAVEGTLAALTFLNAKDFISEKKNSPETKKILAGSTVIFESTLQTNEKSKTFRILEKPRGVNEKVATLYATVEDQDPVFEVDPFQVEKFNRPFSELRISKLIPTTERYSFSSVQVKRSGGKSFIQKFSKDAGVWKFEGKPVVKNRMETILDRLSAKIVEKFEGPAPTADLLILTLNQDKEKGFEFSFWKVGTKLYARDMRSTKPATYELTGNFAAQLPWDSAFLIDENTAPK